MYKRLQLGFSVAAVRCVPSSILLQLCCPFLPGFANAPDTLSIPALHSTFAMILKIFVKVCNKNLESPMDAKVVHPVGKARSVLPLSEGAASA